MNEKQSQNKNSRTRFKDRSKEDKSYPASHLALYRTLQHRLSLHVREFLKQKYALEIPMIAIELPPKVEMGEYALPVAFELARQLKRAPRKIAEEIVAEVGPIPGFSSLEVAGAGYINARLDRGWSAMQMVQEERIQEQSPMGERILVEHTSINPNKAAHIGHLRNAILGDTFVRLLRAAGKRVAVQNYIDNTGVQVADVVVGFIYLRKKTRQEIETLIAEQAKFDYYCWDLYARVGQWYEESEENKKRRVEVLHAIEEGGSEIAAIADLIATTVLRRHLETMQRLGIVYDFLPRESEILHLHFWDLAFEQLKARKVVYYETEGKKAGCWVMKRAGSEPVDSEEDSNPDSDPDPNKDKDTEVIVRSNGTVTYPGKDIAYHLWKFGLLGRDFGYRRFYFYDAKAAGELYPEGHDCWISAETGESQHPQFGGSSTIYNVIDSRQAGTQNNVIEALRGLGYQEQAANYHHFSYEMVALTPRCAAELGYEVSEEDRKRAYLEVSGRKGFGVIADDLIDRLIAAAKAEVDPRHPELSDSERLVIAKQISVGALRYFMLKFTKNSVIAFDFKEALSFEGETGPYAQYSIVRATNIFRKAEIDPEQTLGEAAAAGRDFSRFFSGDEGTAIWELWVNASRLSLVLEQCIATQEPAYLAKYIFQLAQMYNNFYHHHRILTEPDEERKQFLLTTAALARRILLQALALLGIEAPPVM